MTLTFTANPDIKKIIIDKGNYAASDDRIEYIVTPKLASELTKAEKKLFHTFVSRNIKSPKLTLMYDVTLIKVVDGKKLAIETTESKNTISFVISESNCGTSVSLIYNHDGTLEKLTSELSNEEKTLFDTFISQNIEGTPITLLFDEVLFEVVEDKIGIKPLTVKNDIFFIVLEANLRMNDIIVRIHDGILDKTDYNDEGSTFILSLQASRFLNHSILAGNVVTEATSNTDGSIANSLLLLLCLILLNCNNPIKDNKINKL